VPLFLLLAAGAGLLWAWKTGRLQNFTYEDGVAAALFVLGFRMMTTGKLLPGSLLMAGALFWAAYRRRRTSSSGGMAAAEARALLGVAPDAGLAEIRDAHRRLIARVHPDIGGSPELANRVNAARDTLVAELNRRTPRAS
jgi:hypothetical protein